MRWSLATLATLLACAGPVAADPRLTSSAFPEGGEIPSLHTCEGADASPPLTWSELPDGTRSVALIVEDPDAPDPKAPRRVWIHWVVYDLPPTPPFLAAAASPSALPAGAREGVNDWKTIGYRGPCPPVGRHRYVHTLYALDTRLDGVDHPSKQALERAMAGHILGQARLVGTYEKQSSR